MFGKKYKGSSIDALAVESNRLGAPCANARDGINQATLTEYYDKITPALSSLFYLLDVAKEGEGRDKKKGIIYNNGNIEEGKQLFRTEYDAHETDVFHAAKIVKAQVDSIPASSPVKVHANTLDTFIYALIEDGTVNSEDSFPHQGILRDMRTLRDYLLDTYEKPTGNFAGLAKGGWNALKTTVRTGIPVVLIAVAFYFGAQALGDLYLEKKQAKLDLAVEMLRNAYLSNRYDKQIEKINALGELVSELDDLCKESPNDACKRDVSEARRAFKLLNAGLRSGKTLTGRIIREGGSDEQ